MQAEPMKKMRAKPIVFSTIDEQTATEWITKDRLPISPAVTRTNSRSILGARQTCYVNRGLSPLFRKK